MMKKAGAGLAALTLFLLGTLLIVSYVRSAEDRLVAESEPTDVLVVSQPVEAGSAPGASIRVEQFPARLVSADAVRPNDSLDGLVATTDLVAGEQLLWARLDRPEELVSDEPTRVEIPEGFSAVTVPLTAERSFGGLLLPGMRVAVIGSFAIEVDAATPDGESQTVQATHALVQKALVVEVQADNPPTGELPTELIAASSPQGGFLVTIAVPIYDIERIVFAAEWGTIWLAQQGDDALEDNTIIQSAATIFDQVDSDSAPGSPLDGDTTPTILPFADGDRPVQSAEEGP